MEVNPQASATGLSDRGVAARQRILAAAAAELAATGEVEVAAVAKRAGVSVGLPYRYFGTRGGLLTAVLADFYHRLDEAVVRREFDGATWQARERARVVAWVDCLYDEPLAPVVLGRLSDNIDVAARGLHYLQSTIELAARNIAQGQRDGDLPADRDPELLGAAIIGGIRTAVVVALTRTPRSARAAVADQLWTFVRDAVGSPSV